MLQSKIHSNRVLTKEIIQKNCCFNRWFAASHMKHINARRVFPCFDEPHFKAQFQMIINRPMSFQPTISNTRIEKTEIKSIDGCGKTSAMNDKIILNYSYFLFEFLRTSYVRETFEMTPPMSTYLVAFIVSELECRRNDDKTFEVCSRPDVFDRTLYSFDVGQKFLQAYDNLFKLPYLKVSKIGKMTMAAIPNSYSAMENWGKYNQSFSQFSISVNFKFFLSIP